MKHRRLLRLACAACLLVCAASFAYRAAAATFIQERGVKPAATRPCILLRGKQLATFAGYELNATFTPDGKFFRFEINEAGV